MQVEVQRFAQRITTRFSAPERSEGEERSDESTPLLGTNQINSIICNPIELRATSYVTQLESYGC